MLYYVEYEKADGLLGDGIVIGPYNSRRYAMGVARKKSDAEGSMAYVLAHKPNIRPGMPDEITGAMTYWCGRYQTTEGAVA